MFGRIFVVTSVLMSVARVAVGVHWPTDILAGWVAGIVAYYLANAVPQNPITCLTHCEEKITGSFVGKRK
ncbi:MAG: phosphatase PAP2 family protein [bacterium]